MTTIKVVPARRKSLRPGTIVKYVLLTLFAVPWVGVPLWLMLINSVKREGEAALLSVALPKQWAFSHNYSAVIHEGHYFTGLRNSLLVAVPTVLVVVLLGSLAAWGYARSPKRRSQLFFYISALSILLPPAVIPTIYLLTTFHLDGSLWGYSLMVVGTRLGSVIFLTTGFIRGMPLELEEAAEVDGASRIRTYFSVMLPLLRPILFVSGVLLLINIWNDFFFALLLLRGSENATLPLTLYSFASSSFVGIRWNLVFAHVVMTSLPLVLVYLVAQRRVLAGLTEGGLKG
ncbi:carbohydrate ABC transporter permease [Kribbella speibonae]|uniref:Carbohydrate ABC transporter permease n=1 Tax=Kribbella speibonae TaxID=1572660 RepID=A0A4R0ITM5_9ACTN|nr:carbohydrate ABC transporter permease [Kribbella speibonae]TCC36477.1 carbohydrate ABC transporter permease [Kribbella speibonae]